MHDESDHLNCNSSCLEENLVIYPSQFGFFWYFFLENRLTNKVFCTLQELFTFFVQEPGREVLWEKKRVEVSGVSTRAVQCYKT